MSNKVLKENEEDTPKKDILDIITGIFVLVVCVLFPLYVDNYYFNILPAKYGFYYRSVIAMAIALLIYGLIGGRARLSGYYQAFSLVTWWKKLSLADKAVLVFWVVTGISMCSSDYLYESMWGNEGRYSGFFLISMYVLSYFCISRFWTFKNYYIDLFLVAAMAVCIFGITDYFQMDLFRFKENMSPEQVPIFTSTLGNINTYTAYAAVVMAVSAVLYAASKKTVKTVCYYLCVVVSFFAIIMGESDNAYISMAALFAFLPLYLFKKREGVRRYLVLVATLFTVIQCIDWINIFAAENVLGVGSLFGIITNYDGLLWIVLLLWFLVLISYVVLKIRGEEKAAQGHGLQYSWLFLLVFAMVSLLFMLYDCNVNMNVEKYGALAQYLKFDDNWGTNRGYIWRNAMECFSEFSLWQKLVGHGPDTFGIVLLEKTASNPYRQIFDSAHNEYLHYLITVGIVGISAYVVFIGAWLIRVFKTASEKPYVIAVAFGIICYAAQATVNINLPIVAPIIWLFFAMGMAKYHYSQI